MQKTAGALSLSASDLVGHLNCRYLTELDIAVASGTLSKPVVWDPLLELLVERGNLHERGYLEHLRAAGFDDRPHRGRRNQSDGRGADPGCDEGGARIIVQGALQNDCWSGRTDV